MIYDDCIHFRRYLNGNLSIWCQAFELLRRMTPGVAVGRHTVLEDRLYANVFTHQGEAPEVLKIEAHRRFIDIQTLLIGEECMAYVPSNRLECATEYDSGSDCEFFVPKPELLTFTRLVPGNFLIYYPGEGHTVMPQPELRGREVKKVVVKLDVKLLQEPNHHD